MPFLRTNGNNVEKGIAAFLLSQRFLATAAKLNIELGEGKKPSPIPTNFLQEIGRMETVGA